VGKDRVPCGERQIAAGDDLSSEIDPRDERLIRATFPSARVASPSL
jgi:hypothetical protein